MILWGDILDAKMMKNVPHIMHRYHSNLAGSLMLGNTQKQYVILQSKIGGWRKVKTHGFGSAKLRTLQWLVKECNKWDLTAGLVLSDWSFRIIGPGGLLLVVPKPICCPPFSFYGWGWEKRIQQNLTVKNIFGESYTEHRWRCSYQFYIICLHGNMYDPK